MQIILRRKKSLHKNLSGEIWNNFNSLFTGIPVAVNVNSFHKIFGSIELQCVGSSSLIIYFRTYNGLAVFKLNSTTIANTIIQIIAV